MLAATATPHAELKLLTLNVRGLNNDDKRRQVCTWLKDSKSDIILLQETHLTEKTNKIMALQVKSYETFFNNGGTNTKGTMILCKKNVSLAGKEIYKDGNGRLQAVEVDINGKKVIIWNIYAPNTIHEQIQFYNRLQEVLNKHKGEKILGGDFNVARTKRDRTGKCENKQINAKIDEILEENYLEDIYRVKNPNTKVYTWTRKNAKIGSRIDMWFTQQGWEHKISKVKCCVAVKTDHKALCLKMQTDIEQRGPGLWKLNNQHLQNQDFKTGVQQIIKEVEEGSEDEIKKWVKFKREVMKFSRHYGKQKAKKFKDQVVEIQKEIDDIINNMKGQHDQQEIEKIIQLNKELEMAYSLKAEQIKFKNKLKWSLEGEQNSKYFYGLEKQNFAAQDINKIYNKDQKVIKNKDGVMKELREYWQDLFGSKSQKLKKRIADKFLENVEKVSKKTKEELERELTEQEMYNTLITMQDGKSPGQDGLTTSFYKVFWQDIKILFINMVNKIQEIGEMPREMNTGILRLLPKPEKDLLAPKSWRPICLQGVDVKIIAKTIALKLKEAIKEVIHEDQVGFQSGKYIGETLQLNMDLIHHAKQLNLEAYMVSLDIEKAFDSVEHNYLDHVLEKVGFGEKFREWIKIFRTNASIKILNKGWTSKEFKVTRGVRQGDPLSPYLFLLSIEPLSQYIRANKKIQGIKIKDREFKLTQYADDTTVYCTNEESIKELQEVLKEFYKISGYKNNVDKSVIIGIGCKEGKKGKIFNMGMTNEPVRILGLEYLTDLKKMRDYNVQGKVAKMKKILNVWLGKPLTILGKIRIAKTLLVSILTFPMLNLEIPIAMAEVIEDIIYKFIWGAKKAKIKRKVLKASIQDGGLKAPDIDNLNVGWKMSWIRRLQESSGQKWKAILQMEMDKVGGIEYFLKCNYDIRKTPLKIRDFWREVLNVNAEIYNNYKIENKNEVKGQIINNNQHITVGGQMIFMRKLMEFGIDLVQDWTNWRGEINSWANMNNKCPSLTKMEYNKIIVSIPKEWIKILKGEERQGVTHNENYTKQEIKDILLKKSTEKSHAGEKWEKWCKNNQVQLPQMELQYKVAYNQDMEVRLQQLQYKILTRILVTPQRLKLFKIEKEDKCPLCKKEVGYLTHILASCEKVETLYKELAVEIRQKWKYEVDLQIYYRIFLQEERGLLTERDNLIRMWCRDYIIKMVALKAPLKAKNLLMEIQIRIKMLKYAAKTDRQKQKFECQWKSNER